MCCPSSNDSTEGEKQRKMSKRRQNWLPILLLAMLLTSVILSVPILQETRIHIEISGDIIVNVSVDTQRVPLISKIIQPSYAVGAYTINITILETSEKFSLANVPSGKYTIIWRSGIPSSGDYTINVKLTRVVLRDEYTFHVTF